MCLHICRDDLIDILPVISEVESHYHRSKFGYILGSHVERSRSNAKYSSNSEGGAGPHINHQI